jgi:hypothetical protein
MLGHRSDKVKQGIFVVEGIELKREMAILLYRDFVPAEKNLRQDLNSTIVSPFLHERFSLAINS